MKRTGVQKSTLNKLHQLGWLFTKGLQFYLLWFWLCFVFEVILFQRFHCVQDQFGLILLPLDVLCCPHFHHLSPICRPVFIYHHSPTTNTLFFIRSSADLCVSRHARCFNVCICLLTKDSIYPETVSIVPAFVLLNSFNKRAVTKLYSQAGFG